jgi:uncharacterized protein YjdB
VYFTSEGANVNHAVTWKSSDPDIVTVSDGNIVGIYTGKATITVTTVDGGHTASCSLTVYPAFPKEIILDKSSINILTYGTETLELTLVPSNARYGDMDFTSSNPSVATVEPGNDRFLVKGVSPGEAVITATTQNGKTATCKVTVNAAYINLNKTRLDFDIGSTETLTVTIVPSNIAANRSVTWNSSDPAIATVSTRGLVTAMSSGSTTITAATDDDKIIKTALQEASNKFVILDLSVSTITTIPNQAFRSCTSIVSVIIPNSVTYIGSSAFNYCTSLVSVTFQGTISGGYGTTWGFGWDVFDGSDDLRNKFFATDPTNGTPGTYTRASGGTTWMLQQ